MTSLSGSITSRNSPFQRISRRSGPAYIVARHAPPSRTSIATVATGTSAWSPPNQSAKRSASVHSRHTRSRGASNTRVTLKPFCSPIAGAFLGRSQARLEPVEAALPEATVLLKPRGRVAERRALQPRRAQLGGPSARDQPRVLEDLQVLGDRLDGDRERLRELAHARVALGEPVEDRTARRVRECRERAAELVDGHLLFSRALYQVLACLLPSPRSKERPMGRIVVTEFVSLDGVMEDPGGAEDFKYGGWSFEFSRGEDGDQFKLDETFATEALLLGRRTYEGFAAAWPSREGEFADKFNSMPKYVVSSTLKDPQWTNSTVLDGDVDEAVSKLREEIDGDIVVHGSGQLVQALLDNDLVDELRLMVFPVVLGAGKRVFGETRDKKAFRLTDSRTVGDGVAIMIYEPARA